MITSSTITRLLTGTLLTASLIATSSHVLAQERHVFLRCTFSIDEEYSTDNNIRYFRIGPGNWQTWSAVERQWGNNICRGDPDGCVINDAYYSRAMPYNPGSNWFGANINRSTGVIVERNLIDGVESRHSGTCERSEDPSTVQVAPPRL